MKCRWCGEEYDQEMFPVCPFCLKPAEEVIESNEKNHLTVPETDINTDICQEDKTNDNGLCCSKDYYLLAENSINEQNEEDQALNCEGGFECDISSDDCNSDGSSSACDMRTVEDVFGENKFNLFVSYCNKNGIKYFRDLNEDIVAGVSKERGVGAGKVRDIIERFNSASSNKDLIVGTLNGVAKKSNPLFQSINPDNKELSLEFLHGFGIKSNQIEKLLENGIAKAGDLSGLSREKANKLFTKKMLDAVPCLEEQLERSIVDLLGFVFEQWSETDQYKLSALKAEGYTLQALGDMRNLSRERIRQQIDKFNRMLNPYMKMLVKPYLEDKGYVTAQELIDIYDNDEYDKIILYWFRQSDEMHFLSYADVYVPSDWDVDKTTEDLLATAEDYIGEGTFLEDCIEEMVSESFDKGYRFIDADSFSAFIMENGYRIYGGYAVKGSQSYGFLCAKAIAKYFPNGIKLYDHGELNKLRECAYKEFGDIGISESDRAFSARIAPFTILCGRGSVTAAENLQIDMSLLEEIKQYIDSTEEADVYYSSIYKKHEGLIRMMSNIDNHHFLHGVLKWFYADEYDFSNKDYLHKTGEHYVSISFAEKLRRFMSRKGRPVTRIEIKKEFPGLTDIMFFSTVAAKKSIYKCEYNKYYSTDLLKLDDRSLTELIECIDQIMKTHNGCCSAQLLYDIASNQTLVKDNNITSAEQLFCLCEQLLNDEYDFGNPNICKKGKFKSVSTANISLDLMGYPTLFSYSEYIRVAEMMKWEPMTVYFAFQSIAKRYIRINKDTYVLRSEFTINDAIVNETGSCIESAMNAGFMPILNYEKWECFPELPYEWNSFLLRSVVDNYLPEYKVIETKNKDRRFERGVIVKASSNIVNYEDLVVQFLKSLGVSSIAENEMLSLLVVNNLTYKVIPVELYKGARIIYKNEMFYIQSNDE